MTDSTNGKDGSEDPKPDFYEMAAETMAPMIRDDIDDEIIREVVPLPRRGYGDPFMRGIGLAMAAAATLSLMDTPRGEYGSSRHRVRPKAANPNPKAKAQRKARKANRRNRK